MKKFILSIVCWLIVILAAGCADVAEQKKGEVISEEFLADNIDHVVEAASPAEEGYYMVEGKLSEMGRDELFLETEEGLQLYFKLSPETIIYAGENKEITPGQAIRVVFDKETEEEHPRKLPVIAVTTLEEDF